MLGIRVRRRIASSRSIATLILADIPEPSQERSREPVRRPRAASRTGSVWPVFHNEGGLPVRILVSQTHSSPRCGVQLDLPKVLRTKLRRRSLDHDERHELLVDPDAVVRELALHLILAVRSSYLS